MPQVGIDLLHDGDFIQEGRDIARATYEAYEPAVRRFEERLADELGVPVDELTFPQDRYATLDHEAVPFIKTQTLEERHDGTDACGQMVIHGVWDPRAKLYGKIARVGVIDEFEQLRMAYEVPEGRDEPVVTLIGPRLLPKQSLVDREAADPTYYNGLYIPYRRLAPAGLVDLESLKGHAVHNPGPADLARGMRQSVEWGTSLTKEEADRFVDKLPARLAVMAVKIGSKAMVKGVSRRIQRSLFSDVPETEYGDSAEYFAA